MKTNEKHHRQECFYCLSVEFSINLSDYSSICIYMASFRRFSWFRKIKSQLLIYYYYIILLIFWNTKGSII
jgi:hypothetical protein